jgi:ABC-type sulfate/molybdate transport systems ATPase subunit
VGLVSASFEANPSWTAASYLEKGLLLDGKSGGQARGEAARVLAALGLGAIASRTLAGLTRVEWLAVALARASLTTPELVVVESAFDGLGATDAEWLDRVLSEIAQRSRLATSFVDLSATNRRRVLGYDRAVLMFRGRVVANADPETALRPGSYLVTVMRHAARFRDGLEAAGCGVQAGSLLDDESTSQLLVGSDAPELSTRIVRVAAENEVPVLELLPVEGEPSDETRSAG